MHGLRYSIIPVRQDGIAEDRTNAVGIAGQHPLGVQRTPAKRIEAETDRFEVAFQWRSAADGMEEVFTTRRVWQRIRNARNHRARPLRNRIVTPRSVSFKERRIATEKFIAAVAAENHLYACRREA